jgi:dTDP-4-dehydrorhamnose reductase
VGCEPIVGGPSYVRARVARNDVWRADFAEAIFAEAGLGCRVRRITTAEYGARAPRPAYSVLGSDAVHHSCRTGA